MNEYVDLLMPINERPGLQIVHGIKRYEIRTKPLLFPAGTQVWVYASATSRASGVGAILGSFTYGGCVEIPGPRSLHRIALEAAATEHTLAKYIDGRWPAWGLRVQSYERLREPIDVTIAGQGIRRFTNRPLLKRLIAAEKFRPRRPLSLEAMRARWLRYGFDVEGKGGPRGARARSELRWSVRGRPTTW